MGSEILVAIAGLLGSAIAAFGGFRLTAYRIEQVEKKVDKIDEREGKIEKKVDILDERQTQMDQKVDKHNSVIERTFILEQKQNSTDQRLEALERHEEQRARRA